MASFLKSEKIKPVLKTGQFLLLGLMALACAAFFAADMIKIPLFIIGGLIGIIIIYYCLAKPFIGLLITTFVSFMVAYPSRMLKIDIPISTGIEVLVLLLFLGSFAARKKSSFENFFRSPATIGLFLYLLFTVVELFNPNMYSIAGWLFYFRRFLMFVLIFIVAFRLLDSFEKVKIFLKLWFFMAILACAYACYQQFFGMLPFEMSYLMSNPHEYKLYFQGGSIRKFSFLSDPTTFGIMAGACSVFVLILLVNQKKTSRKLFYFGVLIVMLLGMSFSGTRTSNIMLPAALCLYALMTITNKTTLVTVFSFMMAAAFILFGPIQNNTINRIRSTFDTKEESANVRDVNRKFIQPYIYTHPMGGGIATAGLLGEKYNPGHPLAGFPPDSGLLLAAIELGWIGYALTILVYFLMLYQCIRYYFLVRNEEYRIIILAITGSLFSIIVTQYSQVTIGQLPTALFFYACLSIIIRLKNFDLKERNSEVSF